MDCFLGLDLGTSAIKALLVNSDGQIVGTGSAEYPVNHPQPGHAEQDVSSWHEAATRAIRQATSWGVSGRIIRGIGVTGQMHGTVLLGDDDKPLAPAIIWSDGRSWRQAAQLTERVGLPRLMEIAGSPVAAGFQAATIAWLQQEQASLWWRTKRVLSPVDELRHWLTGEFATDPGEASGTLLADVRWRTWSPDLLKAFTVDATRLPPIKPANAISGHLTAAVAELTGLEPGLPVVTGTGDAAAGMLGAGITSEDTMLLSISTGAQVMVPANAVRADPAGRSHTFCSALEPGPEQPGWYQMGATLAAGKALRWLRDEMLDIRGEGDYERMLDWAGRSPVGAKGLLFLPYLVGERTPYMDAQLRGAFLGLGDYHAREDIVRAVLEGTTMAARDAYDVLTSQGAAPRRIVMAGGGARGSLWRQIAADIFDLPVVALGTADQAAIGAAMLAASSFTGARPAVLGRTWASYGDTKIPDPQRVARYVELQGLFRDAVAASRDMSYRLGEFARTRREPLTPIRPARNR